MIEPEARARADDIAPPRRGSAPKRQRVRTTKRVLRDTGHKTAAPKALPRVGSPIKPRLKKRATSGRKAASVRSPSRRQARARRATRQRFGHGI